MMILIHTFVPFKAIPSSEGLPKGFSMRLFRGDTSTWTTFFDASRPFDQQSASAFRFLKSRKLLYPYIRNNGYRHRMPSSVGPCLGMPICFITGIIWRSREPWIPQESPKRSCLSQYVRGHYSSPRRLWLNTSAFSPSLRDM